RLEALGLARLPDARRKPTATIETAVRGAHDDGDFAQQCAYRADELAVAGPFPGAGVIVGAVASLIG
ncbi:MAG: hypothetical protein H7X93_12965, partial [Sphingomonadaceae bacterium]|nr:hypothetical protein [Sphingomonadaceae bacterium]